MPNYINNIAIRFKHLNQILHLQTLLLMLKKKKRNGFLSGFYFSVDSIQSI